MDMMSIRRMKREMLDGAYIERISYQVCYLISSNSGDIRMGTKQTRAEVGSSAHENLMNETLGGQV